MEKVEKYANININKNPIEDSSLDIYYNGFLINNITESKKSNNPNKNKEKLFIHYGFNNWQNINEVELLQTLNGYHAKLFIPKDSSELNFVFRNENNWDNFNNENYNLEVERKYIPTRLSSEVEYFDSEYILSMDLNDSLKSAFKMDVELQNNLLNNIQRSMHTLFGNTEEIVSDPLIEKLESMDISNIEITKDTQINRESSILKIPTYSISRSKQELKKIALYKQLQLSIKKENALVPTTSLARFVYESSLSDSLFSIAKYVVNFVKSMFSLSSIKERSIIKTKAKEEAK